MKILAGLLSGLICGVACASDAVTVDFSRFVFPASSATVGKKNSSPVISRTLLLSGGAVLEDRAEAAVVPSSTKLGKDILDSRDYCELTTSYLGSGPLPKGDYALPRATYPIRVDVSGSVMIDGGKNGTPSTAWLIAPLYAAGKIGRFATVPATFGAISGSFSVPMLQCKTHFDPSKSDVPSIARMIENAFGNTVDIETVH